MVTENTPLPKRNAHVYLMGICGTAMASLAGLLKEMGYKVSGSDANVYPPMSVQLAQLGIPVHQGYAAKNLEPRPQLVIVGNVITKNNPEAVALMEAKIPYMSLPQAMAEFAIGERESIVVAGTHGKTTTTSLLAWIAQSVGAGSGFMIGGIAKNFNKSFQLPERNTFIIEGDEYDTAFFDKTPKFIHYKPRHVILTSVEFDHADIYADLEAVKKSFTKLLELIPRQGTLIASAEDATVQSLLKKCAAQKILSYGIETGDLQARHLIFHGDGTEFDIFKYGAKVEKIRMKLFGEYNVRNALAAYAMATELGWSSDKVRKAVAAFEGVKRRQEILGHPGGVTIIEDFAHHPTAVRETLKAVHQHYEGRKIFAVLELRSATSRRKVFQKDYVQALSGDHVVVLPPAFNLDKLDPQERFSVETLVQDLTSAGTETHLTKGVDDVVEWLSSHAHSGDVVVIMSNGGFEGIYQKLLNALQ